MSMSNGPYGSSFFGMRMPYGMMFGGGSGNPVKLGPFVGGLNTYSDPTSIGDTEVALLENMEVDLDGALVSRLPIIDTADPIPGTSTDMIRVLGYFTFTDGKSYLLAANQTAGGIYYYVDGAWSAVVTGTTTLKASCMVQYQNKAWIVAQTGSTTNSGSWDPVAGFSASGTMPKGNSACVYKERVFVGAGDSANSNRVFFCPAANPGGTWNSLDFFDVNSGDGQSIVDLYAYQDSIVIFKTTSTFLFSYDTQPARAVDRKVSNAVSVDAKDCVIEYENNLYVIFRGFVYEINNWNFAKINIKVPFNYLNSFFGTTRQDTALSLVRDRLLVKYYDVIYVFGLKTRTWSLWRTETSGRYVGKLFQYPIADSTTGFYSYFGLKAVKNGLNLYSITDGYTATNTETFTCKVQTKNYDFNVSYSYKRLFWWGADLLAKSSTIIARVNPVVYGSQVTWSNLSGNTWASLAGNTWAQPLDPSLSVTENTSVNDAAYRRVFQKYLKSLRCRQVNFYFESDNDGSSTKGPLKIMSFTAFVSNKETVVKGAS